MSEPTVIDVAVKQGNNTYQTARVNGVSASCTAGEEQAAERFGRKYFGPAYTSVALVEAGTPYKPALWRVSADPKAYAWCWASGLIEVGYKAPKTAPGTAGPLTFASGPMRALQDVLGGAARHGMGKSAGKLLVPGVPESTSQKDGMTALLLWVNRMAVRNGDAHRNCVVVSRNEDEL